MSFIRLSQRSGLGVTLGWQVNQKASHYDTEVIFLSARPELGLPPPSCLSLPPGARLSSTSLPAKLESMRGDGRLQSCWGFNGAQIAWQGCHPQASNYWGSCRAEGDKPQSQLWGGRAQPREVASWPALCFMGPLALSRRRREPLPRLTALIHCFLRLAAQPQVSRLAFSGSPLPAVPQMGPTVEIAPTL